jgi:hypothetical protein
MRLSKKATFAIAFSSITAMAGPGMSRAAVVSPITFKPLQGVSLDIGAKRAVGFFLSEGDACKLTLTLVDVLRDDQVNGLTATRMTVAIDSGKAAHLDTAEGKSLEFNCHSGAQVMSIAFSN